MTSDSDSDDDDYDAEVEAQALCNGHHKVISTTLYMVISSALFLSLQMWVSTVVKCIAHELRLLLSSI